MSDQNSSSSPDVTLAVWVAATARFRAFRGHSQPFHLPPAALDRSDVSGIAGEVRAESGADSRCASETSKVKASMSVRMETFIANRLYAPQWGTQ